MPFLQKSSGAKKAANTAINVKKVQSRAKMRATLFNF